MACQKHLVSDNGSQFTSETFQHFCHLCCITYVWSPSYHPQSNGQAELFVDTFKCALLKTKREGTTAGDTKYISFIPNNTKCYSEKWNVSSRSTHGIKAQDHTGCFTQKQRQDTSQNNTKLFSVGTPAFVRNNRPRKPNLILDTKYRKKRTFVYYMKVEKQF